MIIVTVGSVERNEEVRISELVIAIDSSTTSTKAIVVDAQGQVLADAKVEFPMTTPQLSHYEQDPADWWNSTKAAVGQAVSQLSATDRGRFRYVCATVQRQYFALVDDQGKALRPGILWLDGRAAKQVQDIGSRRVHELSGFQPDATPSIYKIAWLKQHEPETLQEAAEVVGMHEYLTHAMTGRRADSVATADSLGLLDSAGLTYAEELLDLAGIERLQLAELVPPLTACETDEISALGTAVMAMPQTRAYRTVEDAAHAMMRLGDRLLRTCDCTKLTAS